MTLNQAMTVGAIGFAAFAVYYITRSKPAGQVSAQPAQVQRDAGLGEWNGLVNQQSALIDQAFGHYAIELDRKLRT